MIWESTTFVKYCFKFNIRRLFEKIYNKSFRSINSTINVFWDSHSVHWWENISIPKINICSYHLWPRLMYSFWRDWLKLLNISDKNYWIKNWDIVCFSFWEIDCRCQVHKYVSDSTSYQEIIDRLCENYFQAIKDNIKQYDNLSVYVYNILPPTSSDQFPNDIEFPRLWNDWERKKYYEYMNSKLKKMCEENNYAFIDVYQDYSLNNWFLNKSLSDWTVHISDPTYLEKELKEILFWNISWK